MPFIVRWPAKVKAGSKSASAICLSDFMATAADITGVKLTDEAGVDSFSFLPELLGTGKSARPSVVHHSITGQFAIRKGRWKLAFCPGSGGWSKPGDVEAAESGLPAVQLFDLTSDIAEQTNLQATHPEIVRELTEEMAAIVANGRSTPGPMQQNDRNVDFRKARPSAAK